MARNDALNGALPILVLKILDRRGPMHGYGITSHIESASDHLRVEEGSLYPALHRLEEAKLVKAKWATTENNRRARMYDITAAGRRQLGVEDARYHHQPTDYYETITYPFYVASVETLIDVIKEVDGNLDAIAAAARR